MADTELDDVLRTIGANIQHHRRVRDLTQSALAEQAEVSTRFLQSLETGSLSPSLKTLVAISNALRVPISSFFAERTAEKRGPGRPSTKTT